MRVCPLLIAAILFMSSTARACLNDREVIIAEKEFRSAYLDRRQQTAGQETSVSFGWLAIAVGGGSIIASVLVLRRNPAGQIAPA